MITADDLMDALTDLVTAIETEGMEHSEQCDWCQVVRRCQKIVYGTNNEER